MKSLALLLLAALASGCAYTQVKPGPSAPLAALPARGPVCVMMAADGAYGGKPYPGSGREVSLRVLSAAREVDAGAALLDAPDERAAARQCAGGGAGLLLAPAILHWEDRATQWSGLRDLVRVELRLLQAPDGKALRRLEFEARNSWFAFVNDPPGELLDEAFSRFVRRAIAD